MVNKNTRKCCSSVDNNETETRTTCPNFIPAEMAGMRITMMRADKNIPATLAHCWWDLKQSSYFGNGLIIKSNLYSQVTYNSTVYSQVPRELKTCITNAHKSIVNNVSLVYSCKNGHSTNFHQLMR